METYSFGEWMKQRRKGLRLTQKEVATAAFCSAAMIKKIEADERFPSPELAQSLAAVLAIVPEQRSLFIQVARGQRPVDRLIGSGHMAEISPPPLPVRPLPQSATPFIGRSLEIEKVVNQLKRLDVRLVTLLGPGGIGKTRLALEVAGRLLSEFGDGAIGDGAIFVPLAAVEDVSHLPQAIFQARQLTLAGNDPPLVQLKRFLHRRQLLLILDNFEQLTAGAERLSELLAAAPGLKILVTSRERLDLMEEWLFPVPALDEAAALFGQRALRVKPDFDPLVEETAVSHICALVGGHPLAIELAASWSRYMPAAHIAAKIEQDLDFLANGPRNLPERQRSIRAIFDHSWQLLSPAEQTTLTRLSVFQGGFEPEQALGVGADWAILQGLVDKSLVVGEGNGRFNIHDLTRQYTAEKLTASGQLTTAQQAHFDAFAALSESLADHFVGPNALANYRKSVVEYENFQAALNWGLETNLGEKVLVVLSNLFIFWLRSGHWQDGKRLGKRALSQTSQTDSAPRCMTMATTAVYIGLQGRFGEAQPLVQAAYQMARRLEDPWCLAMNLQIQGQARADKAGAMAAFDEGIAICHDYLDNGRLRAFLGYLLGLKGDRLQDFAGTTDEAKACYEASVAHLRTLGDTFWIAYPLGNLGRLALQEGKLAEAERLITESATITSKSGNRVGIADWRFRLGQVQLYLGQLDSAEQNLALAFELYEEIGSPYGPAGVLSNLALLAVAQGRRPEALSRIQHCFVLYRRLRANKQKADFASDFLDFGDTLDSLLHAGLVAHTLGDWQKGLTFFAFCRQQAPDFEAIRPLWEWVAAARTEIERELAEEGVTAVLTQTKTLTLEALLAIYE